MAGWSRPLKRSLVITPTAQRQLDASLRTSLKDFGSAAGDRYRNLILVAFAVLADEPMRMTTVKAPVSRPAWMFHLRHARRMVPAGESVARPRHFVVYRFDDHSLEIVKILDDRMDPPRRLL